MDFMDAISNGSMKIPPEELPPISTCDFCNGVNAMLKCSACKCKFYCDISCQKNDWKIHKQNCNHLRVCSGKVLSDISAVDAKIKEYDELKSNECAICLEVLEDSAVKLDRCSHAFCASCLRVENMGMTFPCPLCKTEQNMKNVYFRMLNNVEMFILKAKCYPHGSELCLYYSRDIARKEFSRAMKCIGDKVALEANYAALTVTEADILYLEGKYQESIETSERGISKLESLSETELPGDWKAQRTSYCNRALGIIVLCCFELNDYRRALEALMKQTTSINFAMKTRGLRDYFHNMSVCFYELGEFEGSITAGESALAVNRSFEGAYRPIAMSYKGLGMLDHAIWIMRKAVRYETPWDADNRTKVEKLLEELLELKMNEASADGTIS